ncbi:uncharacterized protein LOC133150542 isoform X14 [Syngnathus typhle]|nr:uncharacterized protein LOC133150542 isoform X14 [Syngnathus typhle]
MCLPPLLWMTLPTLKRTLQPSSHLRTKWATLRFTTNHIVKFADDTTVVGLISDNDDLDYREEVEQLVGWCRDNGLILNVEKTKEIIVDFRKNQPHHAPLIINSSAVEVVSSTKFLGVHITDDLTWTGNTTTLVKRAQKRLYFLRRMRRAHLPPLIILPKHHREHSDELSLGVVWGLQRLRLEERKESGEDSREDHRSSSSLHSGLVIPALRVPSPKYY